MNEILKANELLQELERSIRYNNLPPCSEVIKIKKLLDGAWSSLEFELASEYNLMLVQQIKDVFLRTLEIQDLYYPEMNI